MRSRKRSSRTICADALSEQAQAKKDASNNNDMDFVKKNHDAFIKSLKELAEKIL
jgi:hypothetical protein